MCTAERLAALIALKPSESSPIGVHSRIEISIDVSSNRLCVYRDTIFCEWLSAKKLTQSLA